MSFTFMTATCYIFPPPGLGVDEPFVGFEESTGIEPKSPSLAGSVVGGVEKHAKSVEMQV